MIHLQKVTKYTFPVEFIPCAQTSDIPYVLSFAFLAG